MILDMIVPLVSASSNIHWLFSSCTFFLQNGNFWKTISICIFWHTHISILLFEDEEETWTKPGKLGRCGQCGWSMYLFELYAYLLAVWWIFVYSNVYLHVSNWRYINLRMRRKRGRSLGNSGDVVSACGKEPASQVDHLYIRISLVFFVFLYFFFFI